MAAKHLRKREKVCEPITPSFWDDSPAERTIWPALGYIEAAYFLAKALVEDEFSRQYRSSRVVLHLTYHAIELFFKGALLERGIIPKLHHRILDLQREYENAYPGALFAFEIPFELPGPETAPLFPERALPSKTLDDQTFRYATGRDGRCFDESDEFDPELRLEQIEVLSMRMNQLFFKLRHQMVGH
jgi:hypothetical protein